MKVRHVLEAAGAAILALFPYFYQLVLPLHLSIYHHNLPLTTIVRGLLLDMLGVFVLGTVLITIVSRLSARPRKVVGAVLAGMVIWRFMQVTIILVRDLGSSEITGISGFVYIASHLWDSLTVPLKFAVPLLLAVFAWWIPAISRPFVRGARLGLAGFAFSAVWIAAPLFSLAFAIHSPTPPQLVSAQSQTRQDKRVVWILFDELSYDLAFEHRPPMLQLPQLEKLHSTSVSLGNLEPAGYSTDRIVPSLLLGQRIDRFRSDLEGNLSYMDPARHRWLSYDADKTLFGLANTNGWNPGVSGWYNPYCRVFASVLSSCLWRQNPGIDISLELMGASSDKSSLENALTLPRYFLLSHLARNMTDDKTFAFDLHVQNYRSIMTEASALIQSNRVHFIFLHLPVPHPPGLYERKTHQLNPNGSYLDNLVLADDTLGELMQVIGRTPSADRTTVIVSSDHSWRVPLWRGMPGWTKEEEQISQGRFDPRPVFLVHFPGEKSGYDVPTPLPELVEHDIIESMLKGEIKTPEDLGAFLRSSTQQVAHTD